MAEYRIRALANPPHAGYRSAGKFFSSSDWTILDLSPAEAKALSDEARLIVELGGVPKNVDKARKELVEAQSALESEIKAHAETSAELELTSAELKRVSDELAVCKSKLAVASK